MTPSKRFLIISLLIIFLFSVLIKPALAARELEVQIPGLKTTTLPALPDYIKAIFEFSLMAVGIICFGALIYGGIRWLTSAGNPAVLSDAKDQIFSALLGLIILFSAYLILRTINPELVILNPTPGGGCHSKAECPAGNYRCTGMICVKYIPTTPCASPSDCCPPPLDTDPDCTSQSWRCIANYCTLSPGTSWGTESCGSYTTSADCTRNINPTTGLSYCDFCLGCSSGTISEYGADKCVTKGGSCTYTAATCP